MPTVDQITHAHFVADVLDPETGQPITPGGPSGVTLTISDADPGAIGAGNIWVRTIADHAPSIWVRSEADDGWVDEPGAGSGYVMGLAAYDGSDPVSMVEVHDAITGVVLSSFDDGVVARSLRLNSLGLDILFDNGVEMTMDANGFTFYPAAGPSFKVTDAGILYNNKVIGTQAAHVADGSTVDQLRDALIASGLMAAS